MPSIGFNDGWALPVLDGITVDQVRTFLAAVEEGSFSAAGRRLGRAQSVVSQTLAVMEERLGVALFERSGRYPVLTPQGSSLVADARSVLGAMAAFKGRAAQLSAGLEPEVAITVDVMLPLDVVTRAAAAFEAQFPSTALRLSIEALGAVVRGVISGSDAFAVAGPLATEHPMLTTERFGGVPMVAVAARGYAAAAGPITLHDLGQHRQLVLSDRSDLSHGREFGVVSPSTWRMSDLSAKKALLLAGLGWGAMPLAMVQDDLEQHKLVRLQVVDVDPSWMTMPMYLVRQPVKPPGIAAAWLITQLRQEADQLCHP